MKPQRYSSQALVGCHPIRNTLFYATCRYSQTHFLFENSQNLFLCPTRWRVQRITLFVCPCMSQTVANGVRYALLATGGVGVARALRGASVSAGESRGSFLSPDRWMEFMERATVSAPSRGRTLQRINKRCLRRADTLLLFILQSQHFYYA